MAQHSSLSPLRQAPVKWDVIHADSIGNRWVIAGFYEEAHAHAFVELANLFGAGVFTVQANREWARTTQDAERELRRRAEVTETIEERS